ncbi:hypothetical protein GCM10009790_39600 [Georgenia ruanii]
MGTPTGRAVLKAITAALVGLTAVQASGPGPRSGDRIGWYGRPGIPWANVLVVQRG